ncbi:MAG: M6 family metalloprotease domain-containing protein [Propionibacteriales bacterium]|nr:M6 family metalloprotease domain-containing protein [Propionibacteriales bacterium]
MRRRTWSVTGGLAALALAAATVPTTAIAASRDGGVPPAQEDKTDSGEVKAHIGDNLPNPLAERQARLREKAINRLIKGRTQIRTRGGSEVLSTGDGEFVQYDATREESIFTILVEFGDRANPTYGGDPGPLHNEIEMPDRNWDGNATDDNATLWRPNFDRAHYQDLMFGDGESFKNFYLDQSQGAFLAKGDVSDWVQVPSNEARYGSNKDDTGQSTYWPFVEDTATAWYEDQLAQGKTGAEIVDYLSQFDAWDRYDHDNDGDFDEPDGYIDHFQAIHAGEGEEAGGGAQGQDAIWSHRWYVNSDDIGRTGPEGNKLGGTPIGDTGLWLGDYTTEPENGGLGVLTHEFGHDLGLPDLYDTAGGDNGTGFWTLMSAGSWLNDGFDDIGSKPGYMGPWEKFQLGWLDFEVVPNGIDTRTTLGPAARHTGNPQAVVVTLPDQEVVNDYNQPQSGEYEWWGGSADNLNVTLSRRLDLTGATGSAKLSTGAWYDIEEGYDFLYAEVSTDGETWEQVGEPLDGSSSGDWEQLRYDLSEYAGQSVEFRFRYQTDGGVHHDGPFLDDLALTVDGEQVWSDDVESDESEWTADGWTRMTGTVRRTAPRYYLLENRSYVDYDTTLRSGPYNFGWLDSRPNWVERFPYQNGMLVWYVNHAYEDNNTRVHPGHGLVLPFDARPKPIRFPGGTLLGNRRQPFDATFGLEATDPVMFHNNGTPVDVPAHNAIPTFDDSVKRRYWNASNPWNSVFTAGEGVRATVLQSSDDGNVLDVQVNFR